MKPVIYSPTPHEIVKKMLGMAKINNNDIVYDLGCGDGRILISAIKDFGAQKAIGYEIRGDLCSTARDEIQKLHLNEYIKVFNSDFLEADLAGCSVLTLYLSNEATELLRPKLQKELRSGSRVICYAYRMNLWKVTKEVELQQPYYANRKFVEMLYLYHVPDAYNRMGE